MALSRTIFPVSSQRSFPSIEPFPAPLQNENHHSISIPLNAHGQTCSKIAQHLLKNNTKSVLLSPEAKPSSPILVLKKSVDIDSVEKQSWIEKKIYKFLKFLNIKIPLEKRFPVGTIIQGKITKLENYGVMVEVEKGIEGYIPLAELSWMKRIKHPSDVFSLDQNIKAVVIEVGKKRQTLALSIRKLEPDFWDKMKKRYPSKTHVNGVVEDMTDTQAFIKLEEGVWGTVNSSDLTGEREYSNIKDILQIGQRIDATVIFVHRQMIHLVVNSACHKLLEKQKGTGITQPCLPQ